ncbi:MAG TPA: GDP-L-fucose synthase [Pirellulaceae bacterium]|jgi:GDP-L-fucose synthase|nr:GDP-L-fucose synthase [Pirellulaceae bacterium]
MSVPLDAPIFVAGHRGLVGSACVRRFEAAGCSNLLTASRHELDLRDAKAVSRWFQENRPRYVLLAAGTVGGIWANASFPVDFLRDNLLIHTNVLTAAHETDVQKLLYLGSSCIYPREAPQPMREEYLLTGPLEPTNEPYAIAKIAGIKLCDAYRQQHGRDFRSAMPTNLYGPCDRFDIERSHVIPALMLKFHQARVRGDDHVTIWGTGRPRREFLYVDDLADACWFLLNRDFDQSFVNVGVGEDVTIRELAETLRDLIHPHAELRFDESKPDGTPRKLLDVSKIAGLGWRPQVGLREGLARTYAWFLENVACGSDFADRPSPLASSRPDSR